MLGSTSSGFENHWSCHSFLSSLSVLKEKLDLVPEVLMTSKLILVNPRANPEILLRPIVSCLKHSSGTLI